MRKRLLIPLAFVIALGGYGLVQTARLEALLPQECEDEICNSSGGCRYLENACCIEDPCDVCVCW